MTKTRKVQSHSFNRLVQDKHQQVLPTTFYVTQGSMGIMSTVELRGSCLYYSETSELDEEPIAIPSLECWGSFRQALDLLQAGRWQSGYTNPVALDGHQWEVKIEYPDDLLIESRGSNAYPSYLDAEKKGVGKPSLDWRLLTHAVVWLTEGRWNRGALEL